jgi:hypothetical protein
MRRDLHNKRQQGPLGQAALASTECEVKMFPRETVLLVTIMVRSTNLLLDWLDHWMVRERNFSPAVSIKHATRKLISDPSRAAERTWHQCRLRRRPFVLPTLPLVLAFSIVDFAHNSSASVGYRQHCISLFLRRF